MKVILPNMMVFILASAWSSAFATEPAGEAFDRLAPIINVDHRETTSLNGQWNIIVDPYEAGFYNYRHVEYGDVDKHFKRAAKAKDKSGLLEYDFDTGDTLQVPGDWNTQDDCFFFYEGTIWYKQEFDYDLDAGKRLFVYFGAVNYEAIVYLNGELLGRHQGGFTPFSFEISDKVKPTGNKLVVKVDNTRLPDAIPTMMSDWWNYGGITRRVLLIEEESTFVRDYKVQLKKDSMDRIAGWVQLDGTDAEQSVTVSIPEAGIEMTVKTDTNGYAAFEVDADLALWSPQNPKLYRVNLIAETDRLDDRIGFRSIQVEGTEILLNGKPLWLRGICIHEEAPTREGRAYTPEDAATLLGWAKELNCNFVRLAHYPHNEYMTRMADEMGLLVWSEIPLYWMIAWEDPSVKKNADQQLTQMIARDKNRASIILWSVANETAISEERTEFLRGMAALARNLDPTRLITAALLPGKPNNGVITLDDPLGEYLDVLGCNEYFGWYGKRDPELFNTVWKSPYNKPLIMSETGAGGLQGLRGDVDTRWTEDFQADVYRQQFPMLDEIPFLRGVTPWLLRDFLSPRRFLPRIQDWYNRKGLISERGEKKQAFELLQQYYERKARQTEGTQWQPDELLQKPAVETLGNPKVEDGALLFDGKDDALILDANPLKGLSAFTVEVLIRPDAGGAEAQRFLHIGEVDGDRMLLETRVTKDGHWVLDTFLQSGDSSRVLIDRSKRHPLGQWAHVALVLQNGMMKHYVNGQLEIEGALEFQPINSGHTSIGARLNKVHWYKGAIGSIRISPLALTTTDFTLRRPYSAECLY
jgi:beta-glucuronidase